MIVASDTLGLTLSEVEGDAVLYKAPGKTIGVDALVERLNGALRASFDLLKQNCEAAET